MTLGVGGSTPEQALARLQDTVDELQHTLNQRGALA